MGTRAMLAGLVLVAAACSGGRSAPSDVAVPVAPSSPSATSSPAGTSAPAPEPFALPTGPGTPIVRADGDAFWVRDRLGGQGWRLRAANPWGQQLALPVLRHVRRAGVDWLRVLVPERPNGRTGWIDAAQVIVDTVPGRIVVDLSDHQLRRFTGGEVAADYTVGVGRDETPSTTGLFFVWAQVAYTDRLGPYGSNALGLSAFSEVITEWRGGGRMAIHGTADASDRGLDVSFGCIRVYNPQMDALRNVPMGTPVLIRA